MGDTFLHFLGRAVGKGHGKDLLRMQALRLSLGFQKMGKTGRQNARFPRPGTCQHQQRTIKRFDRFALLGIQIGKVIGCGCVLKAHFRACGEFIDFKGIIHHVGIYNMLCKRGQYWHSIKWRYRVAYCATNRERRPIFSLKIFFRLLFCASFSCALREQS